MKDFAGCEGKVKVTVRCIFSLQLNARKWQLPRQWSVLGRLLLQATSCLFGVYYPSLNLEGLPSIVVNSPFLPL